MQRGPLHTSRPGFLVLAATATVLSCGSGIHSYQEEASVTTAVDVKTGGTVALAGATLDICPEACLKESTTIIFRRFPTIPHGGALSSVFEIEIPSPDAFTNDPTISISTSKALASDPSSTIGFLIPGSAKDIWVPHQASLPCDPSWVCSKVQIDTFTSPSPDIGLSSTTKLDFAIIKKCGQSSECKKGQFCTGGACQDCPGCGGP